MIPIPKYPVLLLIAKFDRVCFVRSDQNRSWLQVGLDPKTSRNGQAQLAFS
jgi:hypothetical protein